VIQRLLNHADIKSTRLYTKVSDPLLSAAILRLPSWGLKS
jgi:site-specific recombinase XerD